MPHRLFRFRDKPMRGDNVKDTTGPTLEILYFGADASWSDLQRIGFRKRNTCLLQWLGKNQSVRHVAVVMLTTRGHGFRQLLWWRQLLGLDRAKVMDVFVFAYVPGQRWFPVIRRLNRALTRWLICRALGTKDACQIVQWCYWPGGCRAAMETGLSCRIVFDADHNIVEDVNRENRSAVEAAVLECVKRADLVVAGSRSLLKWASEHGARRCAYLRNGVDTKRFEGNSAVPRELQSLSRPRIGYVGELSRWIDYSLLAELARRHPQWNFVVIGGWKIIDCAATFRSLANVHFLGRKEPEDVPRYLQALDIGLGLYRAEFCTWLDGDSMKFHEYLAAGLPIVSTPFHPDLQSDFEHLLAIATDADGFEKGILRLLAFTEQQRAEWHGRRKEFLKRNTWECRAAEAVSFITGRSS